MLWKGRLICEAAFFCIFDAGLELELLSPLRHGGGTSAIPCARRYIPCTQAIADQVRDDGKR